MSEQQINSLERFRKHSSRLVLEVHSHCEVPAGCGGVVLRWRNPRRAVPLGVSLYSPGKAKLFFDGALVETTGVDLTPGAHQLALALDEIDLAEGLFMFATLHETERYRRTGASDLAEPNWRMVSEADRTWLATLDEPLTEDWKTLTFDDKNWLGLARFQPNPTVEWSEPGAYQAHRCNEYLAAFLALPATVLQGQTSAGRRAWVRKRFVVPSPEPGHAASGG
jgi:hypothetical protein